MLLVGIDRLDYRVVGLFHIFGLVAEDPDLVPIVPVDLVLVLIIVLGASCCVAQCEVHGCTAGRFVAMSVVKIIAGASAEGSGDCQSCTQDSKILFHVQSFFVVT